MDTPPYLLLRYVVIPVWLLAGFLDWVQHRRHAIARTSGPTESVFHLVLLAEMGTAMMLVLLCEMSTLLFAVLLGACLLHSATAYADTRYASPRRTIGCFEQFVHGYLEVLPYTALLLLASALATRPVRIPAIRLCSVTRWRSRTTSVPAARSPMRRTR